MSDFIIQLGNRAPSDELADRLRSRPYLEGRAITSQRFPWGEVVAQTPPGTGYAPLRADGWLYVSAGRPRLMGVEHERRGPSGFHEALAEELRTRSWAQAFERLTGMFAIARVRDDAVEILTDPMGSRPVYRAESSVNGRVAGWSTALEPLAELAGRAEEFDTLSLAELLVRNCITFPWTSRNGITELPPASIATVRLDADGLADSHVEQLWVPSEPERWESEVGLSDALLSAMRFAGEDLTRGSSAVGVTLSGGWDSRAVLAVVPRDKAVKALTFRSRDNRETQTAARVAAAFGVEHSFVDRDAEYFAALVERSVALLGIELKANAHGLCIPDSGSGAGLDVIVGGEFSDTYLKDHFMPFETRESLRPKSLRERAMRLLPASRSAPAAAGWMKLAAGARSGIRPEVLEAVDDRRKRHVELVRRFRPGSADEWSQFWPTSRQHDAGHALTNSRLYAYETPFLHRRVVDVAAHVPPALRYRGLLANGVFRKLYGDDLDSIEISNTAVAPAAGDAQARRAAARRRKNGEAQSFRKLPPSSTPWIDVQGSWADYAVMQRLSPTWGAFRSRVAAGRHLEVLSRITQERPDALLATYHDAYGEMFNLTLMQIALSMKDRVP